MTDLTKLSDAELKALENQTKFDISKYKNLQLAKKVQLNSAYGALGNEYFRFFDIRQAEAVTLSGQLVIRWIERDINKYLNKLLSTKDHDYVIAIDTDSVYLRLDKIVDIFNTGQKLRSLITENTDPKLIKSTQVDLLDRFCNDKLQQVIDKSYDKLGEYLSVYSQQMKMKRESIADRGIWTAKKRYILNVHDNEGVRYTEPSIKMMGIEAVKSSTPQVCRKKFKELFNIIINGTEEQAQEFIKEFRSEFVNLAPEAVAFPRGVNGLAKYAGQTKNVPIHVRGSLTFNKLVRQNKLNKKYPYIQEGDKIKFIYLKQPNTVQDYVLSFLDVMPTEFDLHEVIDYNKQFEKAFIEPVKVIFDAIGWSVEYKQKMSDLWSFE